MTLYRLVYIVIGMCLPALAVTASNDVPITKSPAQSITDKQPEQPQDSATTNDTQARPRGQLLYENHCRKCHESQVHIRENHKARSIDDIQGWVTKWQAQENLEWKADEILDVTNYLANRYYKFK